MIYVGVDDTDILDWPGTNQLARALAARLPTQWTCALILRHQLLQDPRVPMTSKNSAACLLLEPNDAARLEPLIRALGDVVRERSVPGSDPGLCVTAAVAEAIRAFGIRCQREVVSQQEARDLAARYGIYLEGLGGTEDGVVGALAAVGLAGSGNDGRVVQIGTCPDDLAGPQDVATLRARGTEVRCVGTGDLVESGQVDVGKHLRPNYRQNRVVLFARPAPDGPSHPGRWQAVRFT